MDDLQLKKSRVMERNSGLFFGKSYFSAKQVCKDEKHNARKYKNENNFSLTSQHASINFKKKIVKPEVLRCNK